MIEKAHSRRHFLKVLAGAATLPSIAAAGCSANGASTGPLSFGDAPAGNVKSIANPSLSPIPNQPAAIGRDAGGLYAMTLTCTHQGCDIGETGTVSTSGLQCGCHGSTFDANGNVTGGPAQMPLAHFAVSVDESGNVTVHGGQEVDSSTRTKV